MATSLGVNPDDDKGKGTNVGEGSEETAQRTRSYMPLIAWHKGQ